jgi:hypothetical protein
MARPTIYTEELAMEICRRISEGESVKQICKDESMPNASTVHAWVLEDKQGFSKKYASAKEIGAEVEFDELRELADYSVSDIVGDDKSDGARVQARKLQIDTIKWSLSKKIPKKYGDKLDVTSDNKPIPLLNVIRHNDSDQKDSIVD